jgi:hypothetical protein
MDRKKVKCIDDNLELIAVTRVLKRDEKNMVYTGYYCPCCNKYLASDRMVTSEEVDIYMNEYFK